MKDQYYSDSRDVVKWTVLVRLAREHGLTTILQIAMLTPNDRTSQGRQRNDPRDADPVVARFFAEERKTPIVEDASLKRVNRINRLGSQFRPPIRIAVISDSFLNDDRGTYFASVCQRMPNDMQIVAFADPDIGIAIGRPSSKHVTEEELGQVWSRLNTGSLLAVFQYEQRRKYWLNDSRRRFARALHLQEVEVGDHTYPRLSFLFARKM
jgi:hypothetical protein